jgi:hypothetical protein
MFFKTSFYKEIPFPVLFLLRKPSLHYTKFSALIIQGKEVTMLNILDEDQTFFF